MTHVTVVVLLIRPQDQSDKEQDAANHGELQHGGHHPDTTAAAHKRRRRSFDMLAARQVALSHRQVTGCHHHTWKLCVPADGHHRETAAAAAGERIWRYLLSGQSSQHTGFPSKEVCDESHEFQQGDGVIPAQTSTFTQEQQRAGQTCNSMYVKTG